MSNPGLVTPSSSCPGEDTFPRDARRTADLPARMKKILDRLEKNTCAGKRKIRCPKCGWIPRRHDLWYCVCGHGWNTFDTAGRCPSCHFQWKETACPSCGKWSLHKDWYS